MPHRQTSNPASLCRVAYRGGSSAAGSHAPQTERQRPQKWAAATRLQPVACLARPPAVERSRAAIEANGSRKGSGRSIVACAVGGWGGSARRPEPSLNLAGQRQACIAQWVHSSLRSRSAPYCTRTPGPMVVHTVTVFQYTPLAPLQRGRWDGRTMCAHRSEACLFGQLECMLFVANSASSEGAVRGINRHVTADSAACWRAACWAGWHCCSPAPPGCDYQLTNTQTRASRPALTLAGWHPCSPALLDAQPNHQENTCNQALTLAGWRRCSPAPP